MKSEHTKTVLFIGNSFTYYNDLPGTVAEMLDKAGFDFQVESLTKGGWYLHRYADPSDEMGAKLQADFVGRHWDYLVLQDQSFNPVKDYEDFLGAVKKLCELMDYDKLLLYQTWAYEDGSEKLASTGMTYDELYLALKTSYAKAADEVGGELVPVGDWFAEYREKRPEVQLYRETDHYHPSEEGTRLAARVFFKALTGENWEN